MVLSGWGWGGNLTTGGDCDWHESQPSTGHNAWHLSARHFAFICHTNCAVSIEATKWNTTFGNCRLFPTSHNYLFVHSFLLYVFWDFWLLFLNERWSKKFLNSLNKLYKPRLLWHDSVIIYASQKRFDDLHTRAHEHTHKILFNYWCQIVGEMWAFFCDE